MIDGCVVRIRFAGRTPLTRHPPTSLYKHIHTHALQHPVAAHTHTHLGLARGGHLDVAPCCELRLLIRRDGSQVLRGGRGLLFESHAGGCVCGVGKGARGGGVRAGVLVSAACQAQDVSPTVLILRGLQACGLGLLQQAVGFQFGA